MEKSLFLEGRKERKCLFNGFFLIIFQSSGHGQMRNAAMLTFEAKIHAHLSTK